MLEQERIIEKIRVLGTADERVVAAMLYGSFALREGDRFSDVDCFLFFGEEALAEVDKREWVEQIGAVALFYRNEFGNYEVIFESLVRAEFHFETVAGMGQFEALVGVVSFPAAESVILVDKTGELRERLRPLIGEPPSHDTADDARFLIDSFFNWMVYGFNLLGRGEWGHAGELLNFVQDYLLRMARVLEGSSGRWMVPKKLVEGEISAEAYGRYVRCTAGVEPDDLRAAYWTAWVWGLEMSAELGERHGVGWPEELAGRLGDYFREIGG